jgi:hypothetical protein
MRSRPWPPTHADNIPGHKPSVPIMAEVSLTVRIRYSPVVIARQSRRVILARMAMSLILMNLTVP